MNVLVRVLLLYGLLFCQNLNAVEVRFLYEGEVSVQSEWEEHRLDAVQRALRQVLVRILVGDGIFQDEQVRTILANATDYVVEYQYFLDKSKNRAKTHRLWVLFNDKLLIKALHPRTFGFWNEIRPQTLLWLVLDDKQKLTFFDPLAMPVIMAAINKVEKLTALPVLYPLQDLEEQRKLLVSDVLSTYSEPLLTASERYDVVSILVGKVSQQGNCWVANWVFYFDDQIQQWKSPCSTIDFVVLNGFQNVYQRLATFYAVPADRQPVNSMMIEIARIIGISELTRAKRCLELLRGVKRVTWVGTEAGSSVYRVVYRGNRRLLNDALAKQGVLSIERLSKQHVKAVKYTLSSKCGGKK